MGGCKGGRVGAGLVVEPLSPLSPHFWQKAPDEALPARASFRRILVSEKPLTQWLNAIVVYCLAFDLTVELSRDDSSESW
jgi:hypothetical protein